MKIYLLRSTRIHKKYIKKYFTTITNLRLFIAK